MPKTLVNNFHKTNFRSDSNTEALRCLSRVTSEERQTLPVYFESRRFPVQAHFGSSASPGSSNAHANKATCSKKARAFRRSKVVTCVSSRLTTFRENRLREPEEAECLQICVDMTSQQGQVSLIHEDNPPKEFTFDGAYFMDSTAEQIYNDIVYPLVEVVP